MESYANETIQALIDNYSDDKDLVKDCLFYLYKTTTDDKLRYQIVNWFNSEHYCISCGRELMRYDVENIHTEVDYDNIEYIGVYECPVCDRKE